MPSPNPFVFDLVLFNHATIDLQRLLMQSASLQDNNRLGTLVLETPLAKQKPNNYIPWWNHAIGEQDSDGDGTVPHESGSAPAGKVKFIAKMTGFDHQGSYDNPHVQTLTLYCVAKIVQAAT